MNTNLIGRTLLNQFRVDAFIASGGMGAVYRVWDLKRNVPLAMKVLHADLAEDPSIFKRFKREANALKKLAHPNIVPFYGLYQTSDFAFLLERYVDGPSLKDILRERHGTPLSVKEVLIYLKALSAALGYAHANEVVHCDVKPGNVMVDRGGNIYLTDFGIARHSESTTTTLATVGTAAYMAPEQIRGEAVSPATDIYALGVMLFEMLSGQRPFKGDEKGTESSGPTVNERVRYGHLTLPAPDPRVFNSALPESVAQVLLKTLKKNPLQRYQNVHELYEALWSSVNVFPTSIPERLGGETSSWYDEQQFQEIKGARTKRNSHWAILAVIMGFLLIMIFVISITGQPKINIPILGNPVPTKLPNIDQTSITIPSEKPITNIGITETPIFAPTSTSKNMISYDVTETPIPIRTATVDIGFSKGIDQGPVGKIVYTCEVTRDNIYDQICIINADGTGQRQLTDTEGSAIYPAISPDGNHIVFVSNQSGDHDIYEMDLSTGAIQRLTTGLGDPSNPRISPDGRLVAFKNKRDNVVSLYIMNRDGTNIHTIYSGGGVRPAWSSDGSQLSFFNESDGSIYVIDADGNNPHPITFLANVGAGSSWSPDGKYIAIHKGPEDNRQIYLLDTNGSIIKQVTNSGDNLSPTFSPNGGWIGFVCYPPGAQSTKQGEICIIKTDGTDIRVLTHNSLLDWLPYWGS